jgi:hypothetical protein
VESVGGRRRRGAAGARTTTPCCSLCRCRWHTRLLLLFWLLLLTRPQLQQLRFSRQAGSRTRAHRSSRCRCRRRTCCCRTCRKCRITFTRSHTCCRSSRHCHTPHPCGIAGVSHTDEEMWGAALQVGFTPVARGGSWAQSSSWGCTRDLAKSRRHAQKESLQFRSSI